MVGQMVIIALPSQWAVKILASRPGTARLWFGKNSFLRSDASVLFDGIDHRVGSLLREVLPLITSFEDG